MPQGSFTNIDEDSNNGAVLALKEQLAQANQKIAQLEAKIANAAGQRKDHLSSAEVSGDMAQTIDAILAAQSKSLPPVLIILIALFCFLLGIQTTLISRSSLLNNAFHLNKGPKTNSFDFVLLVYLL